MENWLAILIVAALAAVFTCLSAMRVKKLHAPCDAYAKTFCEIADYVLPGTTVKAELAYDVTESGGIAVRGIPDQPQELQEMLKKGVDAFLMEKIRDLYILRDEAQSMLTTVNLVGNKYNAVLNSTYDMVNYFLSVVANTDAVKTKKDLDLFHYMLKKQAYIRNVTLAAIVSPECKKQIAV